MLTSSMARRWHDDEEWSDRASARCGKAGVIYTPRCACAVQKFLVMTTLLDARYEMAERGQMLDATLRHLVIHGEFRRRLVSFSNLCSIDTTTLESQPVLIRWRLSALKPFLQNRTEQNKFTVSPLSRRWSKSWALTMPWCKLEFIYKTAFTTC